MEIHPESRLFWFLKDGVSLDLSDPSILEMYFQQVAVRGRAEDVRILLKRVHPKQLRNALEPLKRFLPLEVRMFWEDFVASHQ